MSYVVAGRVAYFTCTFTVYVTDYVWEHSLLAPYYFMTHKQQILTLPVERLCRH